MFSDRERIGDLHDVVIQRLFATGLQLQGISMLTGDAEVAERLEQAVGALDLTIRDIRGTVFELQNRRSASLRQGLRTLGREYVPVLGLTPPVRTAGRADGLGGTMDLRPNEPRGTVLTWRVPLGRA